MVEYLRPYSRFRETIVRYKYIKLSLRLIHKGLSTIGLIPKEKLFDEWAFGIRMHGNWKEHKNYVGGNIYDSYKTFCVIRDPMKWIISFYHYAKKSPQHKLRAYTENFETFVDEVLFKQRYSQYSLFADEDFIVKVDAIFSLDVVSKNVEMLDQWLGLNSIRKPIKDLPRVNTSAKKTEKIEISDELRHKIEDAMSEDIKIYNLLMEHDGMLQMKNKRVLDT